MTIDRDNAYNEKDTKNIYILSLNLKDKKLGLFNTLIKAFEASKEKP